MSKKQEIRATDLLREYGEAIRGSWALIDGRGVRDDMGIISDLVEESENCYLDSEVVFGTREMLGICPYGKGHWIEFCDDHCNE